MSKNVVITGGNSGIGLETARGLYADGHHLIIGSRNQQKSLDAIQDIRQSRPQSSGSIKYFPLDLAQRQSVEAFAEHVRGQFEHLDILINNSGLMRNEKALHENGVEMTYMVNHFGHFLLTYLLFGLLTKAKEARIINVSSKLHLSPKESPAKDLACREGWGAFESYGRSKLANVMFTVSLADRLSNRPSIKAMSLHPGVVASDFYSGSCAMRFFRCCCCCLMVDNERGARCSLHLSRVPFAELRSGAYYDDDTAVREMNPIAQDRQEDQRLWEASEHLYGITFSI
jgi:retinol dehydrogenase 12